nr:MAG TPA: hypothetical protein [Caudoviricetes sp.]
MFFYIFLERYLCEMWVKFIFFGERYKLHSTVGYGYGLKVMLFAVFLLESFAFLFGCLHPLKERLGLFCFLLTK